MSTTNINPNNWHWTSKDVRVWSKQYFDKTLTQIRAQEGTAEAKISGVSNCDGDIDVAMRKRKIITIYDVKMQLEFEGKVGEEPARGSITIPEVSHDLEKDEYVFELDVVGETKEKEPIKDLIRRKIIPQLRDHFAQFSQVLIDNHARDVYIQAEDKPQAADGKSTSQTATATASGPSQPVQKNRPGTVNTTSLSDNIEFQAPAAELYQVFADHQRLAAWTRAPPKSDFREGGEYSLFGGNVTGEYKVLEPNKKIEQTWRLQSWASGHHARLTLEFDQGTDTTLLRMRMDGVPVGQEDTVNNNFSEYYIKPIKLTFGFGAVL